jgi:hypothetical protein
VHPSVLKEILFRFPKLVRPAQLVLTVTLVGTTLVWPVPEGDDRGGHWNSSQREGCHSGQSKWTNMSSGRGRYDIRTVGNPKAVDWNTLPPFSEILRQALAERLITSVDHPLLRKLAGESE